MTATAAGRKQIKHRIIKTFLIIMRTTIYKTASAVVLLLTIIIPAYAQQETTLIMKNGSKITGNIVVQRPGKDITIEATEALLVVSDGKIKSKKDKYVRYEKLPREWKRWAMETKALQGNADGRYLMMHSITTGNYTYTDVVKTEKGNAQTDTYLQAVPTTFSIKWNDIQEIRRKAPEAEEATGVDDEVETAAGKTYRGTIVSQKIGQTLAVKTSSATVELGMGNIREIRKVARSLSQPLFGQAGFVNTIVMKDGTSKDGIMTVQHYGAKTDDQYVTLLHEDGSKEKILAADVTEYRTAYTGEDGETYKPGRVYVNEFAISRARTMTEDGVTAYVDKKVYPFPEGIVTTFKAAGAKFQGSWHLIALDNVELKNGTKSQGYTSKTRKTNCIDPSTTDMSGGISSISFTYLSPGFYALVCDDSPETYVIKITK